MVETWEAVLIVGGWVFSLVWGAFIVASRARHYWQKWAMSEEANPVIDRIGDQVLEKLWPMLETKLDAFKADLANTGPEQADMAAMKKSIEALPNMQQLEADIGVTMTAIRNEILAEVKSQGNSLRGMAGKQAQMTGAAADAVSGEAADQLGATIAGLPVEDQIKIRALRAASTWADREDAGPARKEGAILATQLLQYYQLNGHWPDFAAATRPRAGARQSVVRSGTRIGL